MINPGAKKNVEIELSENNRFIIKLTHIEPEEPIDENLNPAQIAQIKMMRSRNRMSMHTQKIYTAKGIDAALQIVKELLEK